MTTARFKKRLHKRHEGSVCRSGNNMSTPRDDGRIVGGNEVKTLKQRLKTHEDRGDVYKRVVKSFTGFA